MAVAPFQVSAGLVNSTPNSTPTPTPTPITEASINFRTIANDFKRLTAAHKQLNSFGLGDVSQMSYLTQFRDGEENTDFQAPYYPLMFVVPSSIENQLQFKTWNFNVLVADILERDLQNQVDISSDTLQILQDIISQFRLSVTALEGDYYDKYYVDDVVECVPFMEKMDDLLNGWNGLIKIKTMTPLNRCAAAFNIFTGTPIVHETINFKSFHDDFRLLADHHKQLNSFGFGSMQDFTYWTESRDKEDNPHFQAPYYPLLYVVPDNVFQEFGDMTYNFNIIVADIVERDLGNQIDVWSDTNQILDDIISQFRLSVYDSLGNFNQDYYLDTSVVCKPFIEKYDDLLAGWSARLSIKVPNALDRCAAAFRPFQTPTPTPTSTQTPTPTQTPTNTSTPTQTPTNTSTPTQTATQTQTPTSSVTPTVTNTPTNTSTPTSTQTPTNTETQTPTPSSSATQTPTQTPTNTSTPTNTPSETATQTPTQTATQTPTQTPTNTPTQTPTPSSSNTPTPTNTPTNTSTPTPSITATQTQTPTNTFTPTPTKTPVFNECLWNENNKNWNLEDLLWNVCPRITPTPTTTTTGTPTMTPTPSKAPILNDYITFTSDTTSQTTYTFSGVPIGGSGLIVITVHNESTVAFRPITSATIDGNVATIASQVGQGPGTAAFTNTGIIYRRVTGGTTADISITFSGTVSRCGIGVYRIQNNLSDTPVQSQTSSLVAGTGLTITFTGLTSGNAGICAQTNGIANPMTWTNATENYDVQLVSASEMSGANFITTSSGNRTISTSHLNSSQPLTLVGVVWN